MAYEPEACPLPSERYRGMKMFRTFDEWLFNRTGMDEKEFRRRLGSEKRMKIAGNDPRFSPDAEIEDYRRLYRIETDKIAAVDVSLSFEEYLMIYEGHTEESFHAMCAGTGVSARDEAQWHSRLVEQWHGHEDNVVPF